MALITPHSSIELLRHEFAGKGYSIEQFELNERSFTHFTAPNGAAWLTGDSHIIYPFPSSSARNISINKDLAYELAKTQDVPVAKTVIVEQGAVDAKAILAAMPNGPLVVKPNDSTLSRGLTMDVSTEAELAKAMVYAREFSLTVLVQQQVHGEEIRFAMLNGKAVCAVLRQRLQVVGDGRRSVAELVAAENEARAKLQFKYLEYPQITDEVVEIPPNKLQLIPNDGEVVVLGKSSMLKKGSSLYNVTGNVHDTYVQLAEKLIRPFGKGFIVVDMLIEDYSQAQTDTNCSFMEFNMAPVLNHFYSFRGGKSYDIVSDLAAMIDATLTGAST